MAKNAMLLTTTQVSERLQIEGRTVTRWLRTGYLRGQKSGRRWGIAPEDFERFLESHANRPRQDGGAPGAERRRQEKTHGSDIATDVESFEVQVRRFEFQPINDASYLKVRTYPRPTNRAVRLGVIEWIEDGFRVANYKMLVNRKPMSHDDAMAYATRFAKKFEVPVIYQREDDPANV